jgi:hypothetical protein
LQEYNRCLFWEPYETQTVYGQNKGFSVRRLALTWSTLRFIVFNLGDHESSFSYSLIWLRVRICSVYILHSRLHRDRLVDGRLFHCLHTTPHPCSHTCWQDKLCGEWSH